MLGFIASSFVIEICFFVGDWNTFFLYLKLFKGHLEIIKPEARDEDQWYKTENGGLACVRLCVWSSAPQSYNQQNKEIGLGVLNSGLKSRNHVGFASV